MSIKNRMEINRKIFKSYDIRGVYPEEINKESAYEIGKALAGLTKAKRAVLGRDMRLGSPALRDGLAEGLLEAGVFVDDIGLVPIDAVYFSVGKYGYDLGIMVTASHNPKEYAGFKMVTGGADNALGWIRGSEVLEFIEKNKNGGQTEAVRGKENEKDIFPEYIRHILSFADTAKFKPLKIVIDAGNGMAGKVIPLLFKSLPFRLTPLFFDLDGNFPNHPSNPLEPESQTAVIKKVLEEGADLGVIMDGDTDRLFFIDEKGNFIRADITLLVIAEALLRKNPGAAIAYNLICSRAVPEMIKKMSGRSVRAAVGYVNVGAAMRREGGIMGGELSAHYSFRDNFGSDSGFIALLLVLEILSESGKTFSELAAKFMVYAKSDEVNLKIADAAGVIQKVKDRYRDGRQDDLDGVTAEYDDWWFNVRPSNTEPLLRVTVEADTQELMEAKRKELVDFIHSLQP